MTTSNVTRSSREHLDRPVYRTPESSQPGLSVRIEVSKPDSTANSIKKIWGHRPIQWINPANLLTSKEIARLQDEQRFSECRKAIDTGTKATATPQEKELSEQARNEQEILFLKMLFPTSGSTWDGRNCD
jgi:hypothetical protein